MSAFKTLKDVSTNFEEHLQQVSGGLFSPRAPEEVITKRLQDLCLFSSKFRLLHAKEARWTPEIVERVQSGTDVLADYEQAAQRCVLNQAAVQALQRSRAVQALLATPDKKLDPEQLERKLKILERLDKLRALECQLRHIDSVLTLKRKECAEVRRQWDTTLSGLQAKNLAAQNSPAKISDESLQTKLQGLVDKLELMRCLITRLVTARGGSYDWLEDPQRRIAALRITRKVYNLQTYTSEE